MTNPTDMVMIGTGMRGYICGSQSARSNLYTFWCEWCCNSVVCRGSTIRLQ